MSRRTRKNVGLIGLGVIGSRVREVLRRKGFHVFVWNRTPRPIPNFVGAPAELAEMCDFIQIFVSDDDALLSVVKQLSPGLGTRHTVIAHSTVSPQTMTSAAESVERRGAHFIEAPFTGSRDAAEKGELVYYIGGDDETVRDARPLLEASSKEVLEIGAIGQATAIKVATNMVTAASVQSAAEALALVRAAGLPLEKFALAMQQNASNSKTLAMKLPKMIGGDFERHFSVQHMLKDMQIANRLGLSHHLELAVSSAARDRLLEQMQRGHGDEDYSAVVRKYFSDASADQGAESELELFKAAVPAPSPEVPAEKTDTAEGPMSEPAAPVTESVAPEVPGEVRMPGTPFINPERLPEPAVPHLEHGNGDSARLQENPAFLAESLAPVAEGESREPRGFFSRLLRRTND